VLENLHEQARSWSCGCVMTALLEVEGLTVRYGGATAVDNVSVTVTEGSFVGLIGPNGAGKTSFIDGITGYTHCTGSVTFDGVQLYGAKPHTIARHGMVRSFQSAALFDDLTVLENILIGSFRGRFRGSFKSAIKAEPIEDSRTRELLEDFDLADVKSIRVRELPTGRRKLVGIARALAADPRLVLLDEPAAGLDTHESEELGATLRRIRASGVTILLVDHDMGLVLGNCDEINVLNFGKLIASGPPDTIQTNEEVRRAYLGGGQTVGKEQDHFVTAP
jgi:branched-chain amino acid transport system ATP-binding protein